MVSKPRFKRRALADILVYGTDRRLVLAVEVQGGEISPERAAEFRCHWIKEEYLPRAPYFLLVHGLRTFLWRESAAPDQLAERSASVEPILGQGESALTFEGWLGRHALEMVILDWLTDLASGLRVPRADAEIENMLVESGLYDELRSADVRYEVDP